ncbi:hypothetical protein CN069_10925 [Sinorhizobium meliloti]|nr:hypothetical protein CN147_13050 [Sinorhizobium meliloti]RVQ04123.1 hypothetical protein CN069_10925 [Sinorhizobium meliloti]
MTCQPSPRTPVSYVPGLNTRHRDPAAPRLRRGKEFFQPNDLVWLDSCDRHRNEGGGDARPLQLSLANTRGNVQPVTQ